jgi:hypothetical protein
MRRIDAACGGSLGRAAEMIAFAAPDVAVALAQHVGIAPWARHSSTCV